MIKYTFLNFLVQLYQFEARYNSEEYLNDWIKLDN